MQKLKFVSLVVVLLIPALLRAQTLATRVPADAVIYIGWKGADSPANGYAGSRLAAVIDASNFAALRTEFLPDVLRKAMAKNGDNGDGARGVYTLLDTYFRHPTAIYFAGMTTDAEGKPAPKFGILCQAGDDANTLLTLLKAAISASDPKEPSRAYETGNVVVFTFGYGPDESPLPAEADGGTNAPVKALATDADFMRVSKQVTADPFIMSYIDTTRLMAVIDKAVQDGADEEAKTVWPKVRDASGLLGLKHIACGGGFDGRDWATQAFADAPSPRNGLLTLAEPKPIDPDLMARIPASAGFAKVAQFDFAGIFPQVRAMMMAADPQGEDWYNKGMAVAQLFIGRNLQTDILDPLGKQWAIYNDSTLGSNPLLNTVVVNKLADAYKGKSGWTMLSYALNNGTSGIIRKKNLPISFKQSKAGDLTIYTVETPVASPSWTVNKGFMYFGLTPDALAKAAVAGPATRPFSGNDTFSALAKKLAGDVKWNGFEFSDLPATAAAAYPQLKSSLEQADHLLADQGLKLPENLLPPLEKITAELTPEAQVMWADDTGFHVKGIASFPGSGLLSSKPTTGAAALGSSAAEMLKPAMERARRAANSTASAAQLREIGHQLLIYAAKNNGKFPTDLASLVSNGQLKPVLLLNPNSTESLPSDFAGMAPDAKEKWLGEHGSYVYGAAGLDMTGVADTTAKAIAREKDGEGMEGKVSVLFVDGHVELQDEAAAKSAVGQ